MINTQKLSIGFVFYCYAVALGIAYIFSFWRPFGFNIFPYITITDVLFSPLDRLLIVFAPFILAVTLSIKRKSKNNVKISFDSLFVTVIPVCILAICELVKSVKLYMKFDFYFLNEFSILFLCSCFIVAAIFLIVYSFIDQKSIVHMVLSISLCHIAWCMLAGYSDGKTIFNGAENVHFLEQKELCESGGVRDWVYLEKFGENAFFMNVIEKRICILNEIKFNLFSRKYKEKL